MPKLDWHLPKSEDVLHSLENCQKECICVAAVILFACPGIAQLMIFTDGLVLLLILSNGDKAIFGLKALNQVT